MAQSSYFTPEPNTETPPRRFSLNTRPSVDLMTPHPHPPHKNITIFPSHDPLPSFSVWFKAAIDRDTSPRAIQQVEGLREELLAII